MGFWTTFWARGLMAKRGQPRTSGSAGRGCGVEAGWVRHLALVAGPADRGMTCHRPAGTASVGRWLGHGRAERRPATSGPAQSWPPGRFPAGCAGPTTPRSGRPIWMAPTSRTSSPRGSPRWGWRLTAAMSTGSTETPARSAGPTRMAATLQDLVPGSSSRSPPVGWRSTPAISTGPVTPGARPRARSGRPTWDGSNPQAIVPGQAAPFGIAVDGSHLYWTNSGDGTIWRANLDGTNAQSIVQGEGQNSLFAVAVDASHLYWTNRSQGTVKRADLDGTNPQTLLRGQNQPQAVAVDATLRVLVQPRGRKLVRSAGPTWWTAPTRRSSSPTRAGPQLMVAVPPAPPELGFTPSSLRLRGGHDRAGGLPGLYAGQHGRDGQRHAGGDADRPAGFTKSGDTCTGTSLGPGQSCTVTVQFTPTSYAPRQRHPDRGRPGPCRHGRRCAHR